MCPNALAHMNKFGTSLLYILFVQKPANHMILGLMIKSSYFLCSFLYLVISINNFSQYSLSLFNASSVSVLAFSPRLHFPQSLPGFIRLTAIKTQGFAYGRIIHVLLISICHLTHLTGLFDGLFDLFD
jgi:hypothetical protein